MQVDIFTSRAFPPGLVMPLAFIANPARIVSQRLGFAAHLAPRDVLMLVRWITLALLLGVALAEPEPTRGGHDHR